MLADRYTYPAIFHFADDGISVEFPDLSDCFSCGGTETEAISSAKEALELHILGLEEDSESLPTSSQIKAISVKKNEIVVFINVWMKPVREYMQSRAIKNI